MGTGKIKDFNVWSAIVGLVRCSCIRVELSIFADIRGCSAFLRGTRTVVLFML